MGWTSQSLEAALMLRLRQLKHDEYGAFFLIKVGLIGSSAELRFGETLSLFRHTHPTGFSELIVVKSDINLEQIVEDSKGKVKV
jgi:hypothetical protein